MSRKLLAIAAAAALFSGASMAQLASGGAVVNGNGNIGSSPSLQSATQGGVTLGSDTSIGVGVGASTNAQREADRRNRDTAQTRIRTDASVRTESEAKGSSGTITNEGALSSRIGSGSADVGASGTLRK